MRYRVRRIRLVGCLAVAFGTAGQVSADWLGGAPVSQTTAPPVYSQGASASQFANLPPGVAGQNSNSIGSFADRTERVLSNNPLAWAWKRLKKSGSTGVPKQPAWQQYAHDPIALQNGFGTGNSTPTAELWISTAQICERAGDKESAKRHYQRAAAQYPDDSEVLLNCARFEDREGNLQQAEYLYAEALRHNPQNTSVMNDLGLCLARQGRFAEALPVLGNAIEGRPDKALYRNNIATVLVEMGRDQDAFRELSAVHDVAAAHYNMGTLLAQRERTDDAASHFQTALAIDASLEPARLALGELGIEFDESLAGTMVAAGDEDIPPGDQLSEALAADQSLDQLGIQPPAINQELPTLAAPAAPRQAGPTFVPGPTTAPAPVRQAVQQGPTLQLPQASNFQPPAGVTMQPGTPYPVANSHVGPGQVPRMSQGVPNRPATARHLPVAAPPR